MPYKWGALKMAEGGDEKQSGRMPTVFISYASQDADAAKRICDALRTAGLEVWFDQSELRGGEAWDASIRRQVRECALFMPLISGNTNARSEGYFRREWNLAVHRMLDMAEDQPFLLPVVIDETPEVMARVPDRFRERQWTRLLGGVAPEEFVERVMGLLAGDGVVAPAAPARAMPATLGDPARANEGFGVAVLPFRYRGANGDLTTLAEVISEEIVTGLSRFSYLRVLAHGATSRYASGTVDVRTIAKEIGARYVIEGSLQQAGASLRVAAQLVDATSGAHLWAETYTEAFDPDRIFKLQDELVARIVSTCGDRFGVLARSISDVVRTREPKALSPYEALMRGFGYHHRLSPADHAQAREALERAVSCSPANADCWAMLSWIYTHEHAHGLNVRPASLERALAAARRAVDLGPSNQLAQQALAVALFFRKETAGCLSAAERALALNPLDGSNETMFLLCFTGHWERGCALIRRAMQINPYHPRWYGLVLAMNEYRTANFGAAVDEIVRANATDLFWTNMLLAAAYGELGESPAASNALRDLLVQKEDFAETAEEFLTKWFEPQFVAQIMGGLGKAGLRIVAENPNGASAPGSSAVSAAASDAGRAEDGFWVAVLPFKCAGSNADLAAFAEALADEIVTGLCRFSYLRVIARSSTSRYAGTAADVRTIGREVGARYAIEGSLRHAGARLRLAVQLVDTVSGAHLWAESYERDFNPAATFELQDELASRIVSTVADLHGILPRSLSELVRSRPPEDLSPYEAVLRSFSYPQRPSPEELVPARAGLEAAVRKAPSNGDAWAMLSFLCVQDYAHGFKLQADALVRGLAAAQRAVEAAPTSHLAYFALAQALFFRKETQSFRKAVERAIALNPMDGNSLAFLGEMLVYSGSSERGLEFTARAKQLNPSHPGWYWYVDVYNAYRRGDYEGALGFVLNVNLPDHWPLHMFLIAVYGQLGDTPAASKAVRQLLRVRPDFPATGRLDIEKWWDAGFVEQLAEGWRKGGLEMEPTIATETSF
jgi:TolB-like protein/Tfp pilus assembly protein PilF